MVYLSNPVVPHRWSKPADPRLIERSARTLSELPSVGSKETVIGSSTSDARAVVLVAGTLDTKGSELRYIRDRLLSRGLSVQLVDLSTSGGHSGADVPAQQVAAFHPRGSAGVFTGDRGKSIAAMSLAFERWTQGRNHVLGMIAAGGSGATALVAPAMRSLAFGVPKVLISTVASGEVGQYVGPSDMLMLHSVADIQGLNSITREVLANGADALGGMVEGRRERAAAGPALAPLPALGLTMFGVTTACVQQLVAALEDEHDCLVFHATGIGGRSMESLIDDGRIGIVLDMTTTEVCDRVAGGVFAASDDRFGAIIRGRLPYIGACGALDMVNFGAPETVPERYAGRRFYEHNPQVTLMRTSVEENIAIARFIGERLNRMEAPVRFFMPTGGVSALSTPDQPFHDPEADAALFQTLEKTVLQTRERRLVKSAYGINDPEFVNEVLAAHTALHGARKSPRSRRLPPERQTL